MHGLTALAVDPAPPAQDLKLENMVLASDGEDILKITGPFWPLTYLPYPQLIQ